MVDYLDRLNEEMRLYDFSDNTIKRYNNIVDRYQKYLLLYEDIPDAADASSTQIKHFLGFLEHGDGNGNGATCHGNTLNQMISVFDFFTTYVLHQPFYRKEFHKFKVVKYIPYVPSRSFTKYFINSIEDPEVKAFVCLLYSSALRSDEDQHLRGCDIEASNGRIVVRETKTREARYAYLSNKAYEILVDYVKKAGIHDKNAYLFPSKWGNKYHGTMPVSDSWGNDQIAKHEKELGLEHKITCHTFRRAAAVHMAAARPNDPRMLYIISDFLGHKSLDSTRHYLVNGSVYNGNPLFFSPFDL